MNILTEFDCSRYYLGSICKRNHNWNGSGQSLRLCKKGDCVDCKKERAVVYRQLNLEQIKERDRQYRQVNRTKLLEGKKVSYQKNKDKHREYHKVYVAQNPEKMRAYAQKYAKNNADKVKQSRTIWKANNKNKIKISSDVYRRTHLDQRRINLRQYRARKKQVYCHPYTSNQIRCRIQEFDYNCAYCNNPLQMETKWAVHIDHFLPISLGGTDSLQNLVPSCTSCNSSKRDRDPYDWFKSKSFWNIGRWQKILTVLGKNQSTYNQLSLF